MSLKTRLDNRSEGNSSLFIKNSEGEVVAEIKATASSTTLEVSTEESHYIEKPNGWTSKQMILKRRS